MSAVFAISASSNLGSLGGGISVRRIGRGLSNAWKNSVGPIFSNAQEEAHRFRDRVKDEIHRARDTAFAELKRIGDQVGVPKLTAIAAVNFRGLLSTMDKNGLGAFTFPYYVLAAELTKNEEIKTTLRKKQLVAAGKLAHALASAADVLKIIGPILDVLTAGAWIGLDLAIQALAIAAVAAITAAIELIRIAVTAAQLAFAIIAGRNAA